MMQATRISSELFPAILAGCSPSPLALITRQSPAALIRQSKFGMSELASACTLFTITLIWFGAQNTHLTVRLSPRSAMTASYMYLIALYEKNKQLPRNPKIESLKEQFLFQMRTD